MILMNNENQEWLDNLQVGDEVAVLYPGYRSDSYGISKIQKITPKRRFTLENQLVFTPDGEEYRKRTAWDMKKQLVPVTDTILESIEFRTLVSTFSDIVPEKLILEQLRAIHKIINDSN